MKRCDSGMTFCPQLLDETEWIERGHIPHKSPPIGLHMKHSRLTEYLQRREEGHHKLLRVLEVLVHALAHEGVSKALEDGVGRLQHPLCTSTPPVNIGYICKPWILRIKH